jgi:hypothetical protein
MHERKQAANGINAQRVTDGSVTWNDYRDAHARRIEYLIRFRAEQVRRLAERRKKPGG